MGARRSTTGRRATSRSRAGAAQNSRTRPPRTSGSRGAQPTGSPAPPGRAVLRNQIAERGWARLPGLLSPEQCRSLVALYPQRERFRSFIDLGPRGYGEAGDYRYFARPLPRLVQGLRTRFYAALAPIANEWAEALGSEERYPPTLRELTARCAAAGQLRPTPLLLRYDAGGLNCLHQDRYGAVAFPFQLVVMLSRPGGEQPARGRDFGGGEFLLVEQRPRQQSRGEAIALAHGEGLVFPNAVRPVAGARGTYRAQVRHGVSRLHWGERFTLGVIFHDAE